MSRRGNTDAMCAKFTRFDRMYSHQPAAQVQATQSRATGVNTSETWVMEKALIGLVACEAKRHTAENITKWTKEALESVGLSNAKLVMPADRGA